MTTQQINSENLVALRYEAGMSREELADAAGMSQSTLRAWEGGMRHQKVPQAPTLRRLAKALSERLGRQIHPTRDLLIRSEPSPAGVGS